MEEITINYEKMSGRNLRLSGEDKIKVLRNRGGEGKAFGRKSKGFIMEDIPIVLEQHFVLEGSMRVREGL
jgi:hypothetical protein